MYANDMSLSLKSDTFSALKEDFDSILARTIGNMEMKGAEEATVTLKLGISLEKSSVNGPNGLQDITKPSFKHDISSVMQVKDKKSGALTGDYELVWDDGEGKYVMRRIDNGQVSIFDAPASGELNTPPSRRASAASLKAPRATRTERRPRTRRAQKTPSLMPPADLTAILMPPPPRSSG